jgi:hypothetical protein
MNKKLFLGSRLNQATPCFDLVSNLKVNLNISRIKNEKLTFRSLKRFKNMNTQNSEHTSELSLHKDTFKSDRTSNNTYF